MAEFATGNRDDALDIVQDSMFTLVRRYGGHSESDWGPLFQRILHSRISDWHRRNRVRNRWRMWLSFGGTDEKEVPDPLQQIPDEPMYEPSARLAGGQAMEHLDAALRALPLRQQQAFLLRAWEGLDVKQTAEVMRCSQGSVKTHYFRALQALRAQLAEHSP